MAVSASAALRDAVARFDAGDRSTVPAIVSAAGPPTPPRCGTCWRGPTATIAAPCSRGSTAQPLPASISADAVRSGDPDAIARWCDALVDRWMRRVLGTSKP